MRLEKIKGPIRFQGCEIPSFHWIRENIQIAIEVITVRVSIINEDLCIRGQIYEQSMICEFMRPSFEGSVDMGVE